MLMRAERADYLWVNGTTGAMSAWLNPNWGGVNNGQPIVFGVPGGVDGDGRVLFADLTGDKRDEYICGRLHRPP